jgi:hypothetical protein
LENAATVSGREWRQNPEGRLYLEGAAKEESASLFNAEGYFCGSHFVLSALRAMRLSARLSFFAQLFRIRQAWDYTLRAFKRQLARVAAFVTLPSLFSHIRA